MMCFQRLCQARFFFVFLVTVFGQFLMKGECFSLEIENELQTFTFQESLTSEIIVHVNNITDDITLYVFKDGHGKYTSCKLVLTHTCVTQTGFCQCALTSKKGQVEFIFRKQFRVEDSGVWVFVVWNTNIRKHVNISVQEKTQEPTTESTTEENTTVETITEMSSYRSSVISIAIVTVVIVIAISSIIIVYCRLNVVVGTVLRVFMTTRHRGEDNGVRYEHDSEDVQRLMEVELTDTQCQLTEVNARVKVKSRQWICPGGQQTDCHVTKVPLHSVSCEKPIPHHQEYYTDGDPRNVYLLTHSPVL